MFTKFYHDNKVLRKNYTTKTQVLFANNTYYVSIKKEII